MYLNNVCQYCDRVPSASTLEQILRSEFLSQSLTFLSDWKSAKSAKSASENLDWVQIFTL